MSHKDFAEYDVVITTYGTLSEEYKPRNANEPAKIPRPHGLFSMNWARVVLDEGHTIRNYATKGARAASSLLATSRWVLTGTPIVNSIKDLYSMLKFLRISGGLEQIEMFNAVLTRKLSYGDPHAERVLQSVMKTLSLRRRKDMKFVDLKLPELSEYVHRISFRADERKKYDAFEYNPQILTTTCLDANSTSESKRRECSKSIKQEKARTEWMHTVICLRSCYACDKLVVTGSSAEKNESMIYFQCLIRMRWLLLRLRIRLLYKSCYS
jgi:SNF2 family DNA or RNA helicase